MAYKKNPVYEAIRANKSPHEIALIAEQWFKDHNYHLTKTFGWVKPEDYDNPRYAFLKADTGIPVNTREFDAFVIDKDGNKKIAVEENAVKDEYGNVKTKRIPKKYKLQVPTPEFKEWYQKNHPAQEEYRDQGGGGYEEISFDSLIDQIPF